MSSHPPCMNIHSWAGTEAGCQAVPEPACGEGKAEFSGIPLCMPNIESWSGLEVAATPDGCSCASCAVLNGDPVAIKIKQKNIFFTERPLHSLWPRECGTSPAVRFLDTLREDGRGEV